MQKGVSTVGFAAGLSGSDRERARLESASSGLLGMQSVRCKPPLTCWTKRRAGLCSYVEYDVFLHLFVLPACRMAALLQAFADKRVLVCGSCLSMEGVCSAPYMCVGTPRIAGGGPSLEVSIAFERLPGKELDIVFPPQFDA